MAWPPPLTPPDAGASYLGVYGLQNVWVAWIVSRAPELAAVTPEALRRFGRRKPPPCPICDRPMQLRLASPPKRDRRHRTKANAEARRRQGGRVWKCYRHDPPVVRQATDPVDDEPAPDIDAIGMIAKGNPILDYVYADDGTGRVRWIVLVDGQEREL